VEESDGIRGIEKCEIGKLGNLKAFKVIDEYFLVLGKYV
jgi:hypothetical protein